jgi:integrase
MRERKFTIVERVIQQDGKKVTRLYAKTSYTGIDGKRHTIWRHGRTKTDARTRCQQALRIKLRKDAIGASDSRTFTDLADVFKERYLVEPTYVDGRKTAGMRSHHTALYHLAPLESFFGPRRLTRITHNDLEDYKALRLKTPTQSNKQRKIASVNREMALLRRMLKRAVGMRWLDRSPFDDGDSLISMADEVPRTRTLSREEETRLLEKSGPRLRGILMSALDTGMRLGEIIKLQWKDVDLFAESITVVAMNTKTMRSRAVPITIRLRNELLRLNSKHLPTRNDLVFGITNNVRKSFKTACEKAQIRDFRFHDCRATAITRWIEAGIPDSIAGQIAGQSQPRTTFRYTRLSAETLKHAAAVFNQAALPPA